MDKFEIPIEKRSSLRSRLVKNISNIDIENSYSPEITRDIFNLLKCESVIDDPYSIEKDKSNREMLKLYHKFQERVQNSEDKFDTALRLAIAGNIIDYGPTDKFDVLGTIERVLNSDFEIDHSQQLKAEIKKAKTILYLGDNCGEVVLDKLFLETINHPNVFFAVRNKPILNDVTEKEAAQVGIGKVVKIVSSGDDAPSTLLHRVSSEFLKTYNSADLIISKGMGNYEGLMDETDPRLFFLLMIKCPVIGKIIGAKNGAFVVKQNQI
ncbi:MAG: ARMT1-like domain-containing protein [Draconibacterium sp.]|nr:ARMT1-like domain-containing protein [Draconibacterium sp.]